MLVGTKDYSQFTSHHFVLLRVILVLWERSNFASTPAHLAACYFLHLVQGSLEAEFLTLFQPGILVSCSSHWVVLLCVPSVVNQLHQTKTACLNLLYGNGSWVLFICEFMQLIVYGTDNFSFKTVQNIGADIIKWQSWFVFCYLEQTLSFVHKPVHSHSNSG